MCLLSLQHYTMFRENVFRNSRQVQKDVIHSLIMNVKRQLHVTNANRHYENLKRIRLVKVICIPSKHVLKHEKLSKTPNVHHGDNM